MNNATLFKITFGLYATEIYSKPQEEFLKWLNSTVVEPEGICTKANCPIMQNKVPYDCNIKTCQYRTNYTRIKARRTKQGSLYDWECGFCGEPFDRYANYCPMCGKPVAWFD